MIPLSRNVFAPQSKANLVAYALNAAAGIPDLAK
jgi:hypothetical protein